MARVKKLTDSTYSPTIAASEEAIRTQIDDSIQEAHDLALEDVTVNRKLSATGDFTGTINGGDVTLTEPGLSGAFNAHLAEDATVEVKGHVQLGTTAGTAAEGNHKHNTAIVEVAASRDLALTDYNAFLNCTNAAAIIITIQPDATIDIPIGSEIALWQDGVGDVTIAEGAGVTIKSKDSNKKLDGQNSSAALIKKAANTWSLAGSLTT
jgi:hypothetical protein